MQERLLKAIANGRAPHAVLITGPEGSGRRELARRAAAIYCLDEDAPERLNGCPNYLEIGDSAVKVDDIRILLASAAMQGFNGGKRAFVFLNAQNMSIQIQNTLLKTLEEPHEDTLLLLTGNEFGLLPTIRSRCVILRLGAESLEATASELRADGMNAADARFYAALSDGLSGRARAFSEPEAAEFRARALEILDRAAFEYAPYADAAELVTSYSADAEPETAENDEPKAKAKKKKRGDAALAERLFEIWQSMFRDALTRQTGGAKPINADQTERIERIASRFTSARIQGIIELLARAQTRLSGGASVYLTVDSALTGLFIKES